MQRTILVPLDGSKVSEASLPWATTLARQLGLSVTLARVTEYPQFSSGLWPDEAMSAETYEQVLGAEHDEAQSYLDGVREQLADSGLPVETTVRHGTPSVALLDLADEVGAEAIAIASHGRGGIKRFMLGSVAMQLVSHTAVPVFLVRATPPDRRQTPSLRRLLVPLDGSTLAERALEVAREIAETGATLVLVRVVPWPGRYLTDEDADRPLDAQATAYGSKVAAQYLDRVATSLRAAGLSVETQVIVSETKETVSRHLAVAAESWNVDTLVMSTHGRSGVTGWLLGSVADDVVRSVDRPVLLVSARALAARTAGQVSVGDVMTRDVMTVADDEPLVVALRKLVRRGASGAPVLDANGKLVGVISQRDLMSWRERTESALATQETAPVDEYLRRLRSDNVRSVMTTPAVSIQESASLSSALTLLRERGVRRLPVTRGGRVVGILTGTDVLLAMLGQLESEDEANHRAELEPSEALSSVGGDG